MQGEHPGWIAFVHCSRLEKVFDHNGGDRPHCGYQAERHCHRLQEMHMRHEGRCADSLAGLITETHRLSSQLGDLSMNFFEFSGSEE